jgi:hypothetical protein
MLTHYTVNTSKQLCVLHPCQRMLGVSIIFFILCKRGSYFWTLLENMINWQKRVTKPCMFITITPINPPSVTVTLWWLVSVLAQRGLSRIFIERVKCIIREYMRWKAFLMGELADGWAARDEQPTHLLPHPSLHQEITGTQRGERTSY